MLEFSNQKIYFTCRLCHFLNSASLKQISFSNVIICRGCKANIRLQDNLGSTKKAINAIERSIEDLIDAFKSIKL